MTKKYEKENGGEKKKKGEGGRHYLDGGERRR